MRYAELFAGAGGLSRGLDAAGMHPAWHAEIEPHARAVLRHQWPDVPLYGDVTTLDGRELVAAHGPIDVLSGGSPCQDLSVAGKRRGLAGARSSLFHEQARLWVETGATYLIWENVLGALSSNRGADFALVLSTLVGRAIPVPRDGWRRGGVAAGPDAVAAWRVLDLQHFGPPQRRTRVFVVAARAGGVDPAEVLALAEGVCGHPSPRDRAREETAAGAGGGAQGGGVSIPLQEVGKRTGVSTTDIRAGIGIGSDGDPMFTLQATAQHGVLSVVGAQNSAAQGASVSDDITPTLDKSKVPGVVCATGDITHALRAEGCDASEDGTGRGTPIVVPTLTLGAHPAAPGLNGQDAAQFADALLRAGTGRPRRLTPRECERLMSWPDDWTAIGVDEHGREYRLSDTARYRLCGNGVGSVCVEWFARRLVAMEQGELLEVAA